MFLQIAQRFSCAAVIGISVFMLASPVVAREGIRPGQPAPDFTASDSSGKPVTLSSFKGKTVVLEWTNHECPYVGKHYGTRTMQKLQEDAKADGVTWLTVISSAPGQQGHVAGLEADKLSADRKAAPTAVLLDDDGKVGRLYGASTTPHMFVIDKAGTVAYMGAIDDKPTTSRESVATARPYVREALIALREGKPVAAPTSTRPYGCSVKYTN
ncbi:MAG: thioredoxin family protein [Hyphomicrobiaceae bacterium]